MTIVRFPAGEQLSDVQRLVRCLCRWFRTRLDASFPHTTRAEKWAARGELLRIEAEAQRMIRGPFDRSGPPALVDLADSLAAFLIEAAADWRANDGGIVRAHEQLLTAARAALD